MRINARNLNRPQNDLPAENIKYKRRNSPLIAGGFVFLVFAVLGFIAVPKLIRSTKDYRKEVLGDLRALYSAQMTYFATHPDNKYGNFDELVRAGLIPASTVTYVACKNCDVNNLWVGRNRDFKFEIVRNEAKTGFCMAAISKSSSDRAFAVGTSGVIYEDTAANISCTGSPPARIDPVN
jgi:hypothetical protein